MFQWGSWGGVGAKGEGKGRDRKTQVSELARCHSM